MLPYLGIAVLIPYATLLLLRMTTIGLGAIVLSVFIINPIGYFVISYVYGRKNKAIYVFTLFMGIAACFTMMYVGYIVALVYTIIALIGCRIGRALGWTDKNT